MSWDAKLLYNFLDRWLGEYGYYAPETDEGQPFLSAGKDAELTAENDVEAINTFLDGVEGLDKDLNPNTLKQLYLQTQAELSTDLSSMVRASLSATLTTIGTYLPTMVTLFGAPGIVLWNRTLGSYFSRIKQLAREGDTLKAAVMAYGGEETLDRIYDSLQKELTEDNNTLQITL